MSYPPLNMGDIGGFAGIRLDLKGCLRNLGIKRNIEGFGPDNDG